MNHTLKIYILILMLTGFCDVHATGISFTDSLLLELDRVIDNRSQYLAEKEKQLDSLEAECKSVSGDRERFDALIHPYDAYHSFNADSAYNISLRQEALARKIGDPVMVMNAMMNRADIFCATGMYKETVSVMDSIDSSKLPDYLKPYYFYILRTACGRMADYAAFAPERARYDRLTRDYRDSLMVWNADFTLAHIINKADQLNVDGNPEAAIEVLNKYMNEGELSEHDRAICAWTLSESYGKLGDRAKQKEQLLISSISDLKSSVREYVSLRQLALLLYEEGDLNRAYKFMTIAIDDAAKCNARQRIVELSEFYPTINGIYIEKVRKQKRTLERTILIITVLSLLLLVLILCMRKQMRRIARARAEIEAAYLQLNEVTEQLQDSNNKLSEANIAIADISELKEVYIGKYMDQCMAYIEKLDAYRKSIGKLINGGKLDDLKKLVKSTTLIDDELKSFYDQFDRTFLSLFPSFIEDFNSLLMPDEAIVPKKEGSLTTELRIFALIRLGISDSDKIAKFLHYSLTTIYNYRTKIRNKARGDRNKLEEEMLKIGRPVHGPKKNGTPRAE